MSGFTFKVYAKSKEELETKIRDANSRGYILTRSGSYLRHYVSGDHRHWYAYLKEKGGVGMDEELTTLKRKIEYWSIAKGLHKSDPKVQGLKVIEEFSESLTAANTDDLIDGIGDTYITLIILSQQLQLDFAELKSKAVVTSCDLDNSLKAIRSFSSALSKNDIEGVKAAIILIMSILESQRIQFLKVRSLDCIRIAYDVIKYKKGKLKEGEVK